MNATVYGLNNGILIIVENNNQEETKRLLLSLGIETQLRHRLLLFRQLKLTIGNYYSNKRIVTNKRLINAWRSSCVNISPHYSNDILPEFKYSYETTLK